MEKVVVQFRGTTKEIPLLDADKTTWLQLQCLLSSTLDIEVDALRIFYNKKRVVHDDPSSTLQEMGWHTTQAIHIAVMAGASKAMVENMERIREEVKEVQQIRANRRVLSIYQRNNWLQAREAVSTEYRFHAIETLDTFPDAHKVREILERLANDRGILAVMAKHKWSVGTLAELYPDGKVGVDPVCVLGLNQNKGKMLRVRTDDLLGFRKYLSIKKVLFHELSHNVHSEHDNNFYQLMRQVEKECDELDWTHSHGNSVGGDRGISVIDEVNDQSLKAKCGYRLGGSDARQSRLLQSPSTQETSPTVSPKQETSQLPSKESTTTVTPPLTSIPASPLTILEVPSLQPNRIEGYEPSERERRLIQALDSLRTRYHTDAVSKALCLLHKIITNISQHPLEDKYRSIRKRNRLFEQQLACFPECLEFLGAIGFEDQNECFVLVRDDPALLWIGRSTLELLLPSQA